MEFPYNDFSNNDIYQVSTYCLLHGSHNAILFYPADKNNNEQIENYFSESLPLELNVDEDVDIKVNINRILIDLSKDLSVIKEKMTDLKDILDSMS